MKRAAGTQRRLSATNNLWLNDLGKMKILQFFTFMINAANPVTVLWSLQLLLRV